MAKQGYSPKAPRGGSSKPHQGDHDEVPSGLGYKTELDGGLESDEMAPIGRKAGLPPVEWTGTYNMRNANDEESDPY